MWKMILPTAALMVGGCDKPEVKACEGFIKEQLASPSSYKRAGITEGTKAITIEGLQKLRGRGPMDKVATDRRSLHLVVIEYDAENAYGARMGGANVCAFEMMNGKTIGPESNARMSARSASLRRLSESGALEDVPPGSLRDEREFPCCLN